MSRIPSTGISSGSPSSAGGVGGAGDLRDVDLDQFLQLMITELQNQDPLNPQDNSEILQQMTQIREIGATNALSDTLEAVLTGQNLTTASSLIGKQVEALTPEGDRVTGVVDRVTVDTNPDGPRTLRVHIGEQSFTLDNVSQITSPDGPAAESITPESTTAA